MWGSRHDEAEQYSFSRFLSNTSICDSLSLETPETMTHEWEDVTLESALLQNIQKGLQRGDIGTVVPAQRGKGYEVEFTTLNSEIVAVVALSVFFKSTRLTSMRLPMRQSWQVRYPNFAPPFPVVMGF